MRTLIPLLALLMLTSLLLADTPPQDSRLDQFRARIEAIQLSKPAIVGLISMIPIFELRGAIPVGILGYKLPWLETFLIAVFANMLPIVFILLLLDPACRLLRRIPAFARMLDWLFARTRRKSGAIEKYEALGLIVFVAIPLPGTGAWSGALAAYIFGLPYWKSLLCCFLGVVGAGIVVTILTLMGWVGAGIALAGFVALTVLPAIMAKRGKA